MNVRLKFFGIDFSWMHHLPPLPPEWGYLIQWLPSRPPDGSTCYIPTLGSRSPTGFTKYNVSPTTKYSTSPLAFLKIKIARLSLRLKCNICSSPDERVWFLLWLTVRYLSPIWPATPWCFDLLALILVLQLSNRGTWSKTLSLFEVYNFKSLWSSSGYWRIIVRQFATATAYLTNVIRLASACLASGISRENASGICESGIWHLEISTLCP